MTSGFVKLWRVNQALASGELLHVKYISVAYAGSFGSILTPASILNSLKDSGSPRMHHLWKA